MPKVKVELGTFRNKLEQLDNLPSLMRGSVRKVIGTIIEARLPNARIGELCLIKPKQRNAIRAQVVGFSDEDVFLTALDSLEGVGPRTQVVNTGKPLLIPVCEELLGRIVDATGEPIDGLGEISNSVMTSVKKSAPDPLSRGRINRLLHTGIRSIDTLISVGEGQRMGVFSSAGVGKSSLLGMISRGSSADVNVIALIGERGREVKDFIEDNLGAEGLKKSIVVVSTSEEPAQRRILAAYTATTIAEYFREKKLKVLLLMDSVTRFARALREVALSLGEPPARQGYPPSVFSTLPELFERAGNADGGSITAFYTVLLNSEQIEDPLGEEIRALLDGHLYLSLALSQHGHYPAIDILKSNSRLMQVLAESRHLELSNKFRSLWSTYEQNRELISIGAYKKGSDNRIDEAIKKRDKLISFLVQDCDITDDLESTLLSLTQSISD